MPWFLTNMVVMRIYNKKYSKIFFVFTVLVFIEPLQTFAYIDPGTGSFFIQMIIASAVGLSFTMRASWGTIKRFFVRKSAQPAQLAQPEETHGDEKTH
ncbi:MAG: hypothetical protein G01um101448_101 [Parcubacteria group bacterium Gr01-1014_48]|nr:MAG: hypothetical protein Greene041614_22 [Parcubacteria group bacterium Greene0416_14]TSC74460.1 MAG: hypothetical protein G01um101448_101 [Parcubacteria group bacterium Gr01-1014_48]TSD01770.1 MAG: hypothetical protein Greene101415_28 [Parcubacteria group bacterium Greene1014_15]TSD08484.1 MAG: hypothetical protein Greene07144_23 [Parcubacteria group bacterium Greene0714_4]